MKRSSEKQSLKLPQILKLNNDLRYELLQVLGKGGYAVALSAKRVRPDGLPVELPEQNMVAVKAIFKSKFEKSKIEQVLHYTKREIEIMSKLDHENIVKLYNHWQDDSCVYLILELCVNKTLSSVVKSDTVQLSNAQVRRFVHDMANGCQYMHQLLILHRDLKPENILLDETFRAKIADFGLSIALKDKSELLHTFCGTLKYQAPEMIERCGYSFGVDVWALGCITYRLYYGNAPFDGQSSDEIYKAILNKFPKYSRVSKCNCAIAPHEISMIKAMLRKNASQRIKIDNMLSDSKYFDREQKSCAPPVLDSGPKRTISPPLEPVVSAKPANTLANNSNDKLNAMITCLKEISNYDVNKRIRISYSPHHDYRLMPQNWIVEWIDINQIGFGYLFTENIYGFDFKKDRTQMMLINERIVAHRSRIDSICQLFPVDSCPESLTNNLKKVKLSKRSLLEQVEEQNLRYPKVSELQPIPLIDDLPWLLKKIFIGSSDIVAMAYRFENDLIQLTFIEERKTFLFDARRNSITIVKDDKCLCLSLRFILDDHVSETMQSYVSASLKYINLLLE